MERLPCVPRAGWQKKVEEKGLFYHTAEDGQPYWNEAAYYHFSAREIDELEKATNDLFTICIQAAEHVLKHDLFGPFQIAPGYRDLVRRSWDNDDRSIYGRFDLLYDGKNPPRLAEFNADTPTALLEAAVIQWFWLQDFNPHADQFNSIHERLIEAWGKVRPGDGATFYFSALRDSVEDYMTATYMRDVASQAGLATEYLHVEDIGWNTPRRQFVDLAERPMRHVFKLYPWEWMLREKFGPNLIQSPVQWIEPPWKMLLSNKALLPLLWELNPGHPNLLPASWSPLSGAYVRKPIFGREGANIAVVDNGHVVLETDGPYSGGATIYQEFFPTPRFDGNTAVIGSWLVDGTACGIGVREEESLVTRNTSRFVPHLFG